MSDPSVQRDHVSPLVSVVITNFRLAEDVIVTLDAVLTVVKSDELSGAVEIIVVDNASVPSAASLISGHASRPRVIPVPDNLGRAEGNNIGAAESSSDFLAFLNPSTRPRAGWLRHALRLLLEDDSIGCVASTVLDWDEERIDSAGGELVIGSLPAARLRGEPANRSATDLDVLFAPATSMIMRRRTFDDIGRFDSHFGNAGEDLDLCWRLWSTGRRVRLAARSIVAHRQQGVLDELGCWHRTFADYRGALIAIASNADRDYLQPLLVSILAGGVAEAASMSALSGTLFAPPHNENQRLSTHQTVPTQAAAIVAALGDMIEHMPHVRSRRAVLTNRRRASDADIFAAVGFKWRADLSENVGALVDILGAPPDGAVSRKIAIVTADVLTPRMAGPAIRAFEMARVLSAQHEVRLVSLKETTLDHPGLEISHATSESELRKVESWADVLVIQGVTMAVHPFLERSTKPLVVDLYDPYHFEELETHRSLPRPQADAAQAHALATINQQIRRGDFFLCASEKQRDLWLGHLGAAGRVNPAIYRADETLRSLIDVVPFGLSTTPPQRTGPAMRGVIDGIGPDDKILLWAGGIYSWFDPLTLIRAVDVVRRTVEDVRLVFMGTAHPNPDVPQMEIVREAKVLSAELGLEGRHVFFRDGWVPYEQRQDFLIEADIGVSTHLMHLETAYSFRTRMLDYLWAGLPVVTTTGDGFSLLVAEHGIGRTAPPGDVDVLAAAILELLLDAQARQMCITASRGLAREFEWQKVLEPLVSFCRHPMRAADAVATVDLEETTRQAPSMYSLPKGSLARDARTVARVFSEGGASGVLDVLRHKVTTLRLR